MDGPRGSNFNSDDSYEDGDSDLRSLAGSKSNDNHGDHGPEPHELCDC